MPLRAIAVSLVGVGLSLAFLFCTSPATNPDAAALFVLVAESLLLVFFILAQYRLRSDDFINPDMPILLFLAMFWTLAASCISVIVLIDAYEYRGWGLLDLTSRNPVVVHDSITALYFSLITWTTVGYGDVVPHLPAERLFAAVESMIGYIAMALFIATVIGQIGFAQAHKAQQQARKMLLERLRYEAGNSH